jgi:hypothetical protein
MFDACILEVFIASTNDLKQERLAVEEVLRDWNSRNGEKRQIMLKPIRWEEDTTPELGPGSFQAVINQRLLDPADILIGIVGKRLGSPTENSIAGTVEEIERFAAAKKPVLLYFSDREFNLSEIDPQELERVREFRKAMQTRGLFRTFNDIGKFKEGLRSHLDTLLGDFKSLLIPASRALAYGYFKNFVKPTYEILRGSEVKLPDYKLPNEQNEMTLSYSSFRIRIAKPLSWEDATDGAVFDLRKNRLAEINVKQPGSRRAFRVYVPTETKEILDNAMPDHLKRAKKAGALPLQLDRLDVVDFPTPLIALHDFVESEISDESDENSAGYWQKQKTIQYNEFFRYLESRIKKASIKHPYVGYFDYNNSPDFKLPD